MISLVVSVELLPEGTKLLSASTYVNVSEKSDKRTAKKRWHQHQRRSSLYRRETELDRDHVRRGYGTSISMCPEQWIDRAGKQPNGKARTKEAKFSRT